VTRDQAMEARQRQRWMIEFRRPTLLDRLRWLLPNHRRQRDAALRTAIDRLVADPLAVCSVEGVVIPLGYGSATGAELFEAIIANNPRTRSATAPILMPRRLPD
jgi:hypothetical protein